MEGIRVNMEATDKKIEILGQKISSRHTSRSNSPPLPSNRLDLDIKVEDIKSNLQPTLQPTSFQPSTLQPPSQPILPFDSLL